MSGFNGSGNFSFTYSWVNDAANGIPITASRMDTQFNDAANGFDLCLTRDGQGSASANLPMNGFKFTGLGNGSLPQDSATFGQLTTATGALYGFIGALTLSTAGGSGIFGITAGAASDSTASLLLSSNSAFTKTTASFAAGTGNGALDAGAIAINTWYHVYVIGAAATTTDFLFSLSATSPTLPPGYTLFRRIGSMRTDGSSHWIQFFQVGNTFSWVIPILDVNAVTPPASPTLTALTVPSGIVVSAIFNGLMSNTSGTQTSVTFYTPGITAPTIGSLALFPAIVSQAASQFFIQTNTSSQIMVSSANSPNQYFIDTTGWIDRRGSQ